MCDILVSNQYTWPVQAKWVGRYQEYWFPDTSNYCMKFLLYLIRLVGLNICLHQSRLVIGQFGCSGLPPSDAKGKPAIESERTSISTWYNYFNSWSNHAKLSDFDHYIAVLWIWKLRMKIVTSLLEKLQLWTFGLCKSNGVFPMLSPFTAWLVGKCTE